MDNVIPKMMIRVIQQQNSLYSTPSKLQLESESYEQGSHMEIVQFDHESDFTMNLFNLPPEAQRLIVQYLLNDFRSIILVNAKWYVDIYDILNQWLEELDNKFIKANMQHLALKNSFTSFTPYCIGTKQGFRLDRCIIAELLPGFENKFISLGFRYKWMNNPNDFFKYEFKYDVLGDKKQRRIWILREEAKHNYDQEKYASTAQIVQVCTGDNIRISINFFNLNGLINLDSIIWDPPTFGSIGAIKQKNQSQNLRTCYVEELFTDWVLWEYFPNVEFRYKNDEMRPQLVMREARCAGIDTVMNRMTYTAQQKGVISEFFGIPITITNNQQELTVEIKKFGLKVDLYLPIELRQGDQLVYYLSRGD